MSGPEISPDGRFYWDGARWQPMAEQRSSFTNGFGSVVGGCAGLVFLVFVVPFFFLGGPVAQWALLIVVGFAIAWWVVGKQLGVI